MRAEQMAKLKSELDVVQQNCRVFSDMLTEMTPGQENPSDLELLVELNGTCRQMQKRMVDLLESVQNEDVTCELLRINDELNNVFLRYDRFERLRGGQSAAQQPAPPAQQQRSPTQVPAMGLPSYTAAAAQQPPMQPSAGGQSTEPEPPVANLIDLDLGGSSVTGQLGGLNTTPAKVGDEEDFDMFAQSRQSFDQSKQAMGGSGTYSNQQPDQFSGGLGVAVNAKNSGNPYNSQLIDTETDFEEMEKYLKENPAPAQGTATSSEFDQFLSDRARETDTNRNGRQMQKKDDDNALFSL